MFDERQGFNWGNRTGTIRWNHLFNDRLFSNFTTIYSNYDYQLAFGSDDLSGDIKGIYADLRFGRVAE